ncbi:CgeB family protein [Tessaracoccus massiliensis]|uniref:CgeB family protein n=1 Tax=Tessaracoccus massiliensis TaxID=1522311 RepID=UPI000693F2E1|nr:glycosyltransferase [Tessaracoccus massiliensis]
MSNPELAAAIRGIRVAAPPPPPSFDTPAVMTVLDDFSEQCFRDVGFSLWPVQPNPEPVDFESINPAFLLVESAWNGNRGAWRYQVTGSKGPGPWLRKLVESANARGIPTVFWNKEDPPHFEEFKAAAGLFDVIFTTEASLIDRYRELAPDAKVDLLQFAASTALHRPTRVDNFRTGDVCFAGQYFRHKFPERREQMDFLFAAAAEHDFSIYSRMLGGDPNYAFPEQYEKFIVGSLPYAEMVEEYRRHKVFLNVNSVPSSESMCARRIFELTSAKTIVLSSFTPAIRNVYPADEVPLVTTTEEASQVLLDLMSNPTEREAMAHRAWRRTAGAHTYAHRMRQITEAVGLPSEERVEAIALLTPPGLPGEALEALAAELVTQQFLPTFRAVWLLEPSDAGRLSPDTHRALQRASIAVDTSASPTWWAAWHPAVTHDGHYLQDLALYASRYCDGAAWADPAGTAKQREETFTDEASNATWLARDGHAATHRLRPSALERALSTVTAPDLYLTSGIGVRMREGMNR